MNKLEEENCDHSDIDEFTCLICGEDMMEQMISRAYDYYKEKFKYGDE